MEFLVRSAPEAQIRDGNVAMERQNLGSHLVAMVHLIPAFARAQGRPYGPREMECWAEIVRGLWYAVKCMEESPERSAVAVAAEMRKLSRRHMNFGTFSRMNEFYAEFVGPGDELAGDLLVLINYLVVRGKIRHQEKESARQMRGHTRCVVM